MHVRGMLRSSPQKQRLNRQAQRQLSLLHRPHGTVSLLWQCVAAVALLRGDALSRAVETAVTV